MSHEPIPAETEIIARSAIDAGIKVHSALGPGLLESVYEHCLAHELTQRGVAVERQIALPVFYEGTKLEAGFRIDLLLARAVVVEVKSVDILAPIHQAQLLTYLKLSGCRLGLLMNFNVPLFKDGLKRMVR